MAKYEKHFRGDFFAVLETLDRAIMDGSLSASLADESQMDLAGLLCTVRVYERYSVFGGDRLSLTITLLGDGEDLVLSAITAGGSSGMFKNILSEDAFLDAIRDTLDNL